MKIKFIVIAIIVAILAVYIVQSKKKIDDLKLDSSSSLLTKLPSFKVIDLEGNKSTLDQFYTPSKTHLFVHFWGSWCGPCENEFRILKPFFEANKDSKYHFILVALNDDKISVKKFFDKVGQMPSHVKILLEDGPQYLDKFGSSKAPETFLFGPNQELIRHFVGPQDWQDEYITGLFKN